VTVETASARFHTETPFPNSHISFVEKVKSSNRECKKSDSIHYSISVTDSLNLEACLPKKNIGISILADLQRMKLRKIPNDEKRYDMAFGVRVLARKTLRDAPKIVATNNREINSAF
jgi:hypothetical protein